MSDQIKMFIAGEEVVSQNEFTINEEMLSASSTILNNCYPKSWELTKDYISNFYYPKDYSRFVIGQGEYLHGNNEFEPLEITGKNLLDGIFIQGNVNGTYVNNQIFDYSNYFIKKNTSYVFSTNLDISIYRYQIFINSTPLPKLASDPEEYISGWKTQNTFTFNLNVEGYIGIGITKINGTDLTPNDIEDVWFKLEENNAVTDYISFNQSNLSYNTNIEKEWNKFNILGNTSQKVYKSKNILINNAVNQTVNGVTFVVNDDKSITVNGTATAEINYTINSNFGLSSNTYYILSGCPSGGSTSTYMLRATNTSWSENHFDTGNGVNFTPIQPAIQRVVIQITSGTTLNNLLFKPMLRLASVADNSYEPYKLLPSYDNVSNIINVGYKNIYNIQTLIDNRDMITATNGDLIVTSNTIELRNPTALNQYLNGTTPMSANPSSGEIVRIQTFGIHCEANKKYTLSYKADNYNRAYIMFYNKNYGYLGLVANTENNNSEVNFTFSYSDSNVAYMSLRFDNRSYGQENADLVISNIMLVEDLMPHSYIPYGKYGIEINNVGKNLFNGVYSGYFININTGNLQSDSQYVTTEYIKVSEGDIFGLYTLGMGSAGKLNVACYDEKGVYLSHPVNNLNGFKSFTIPSGVSYIRCVCLLSQVNATYLYKNATTASEYEEYKKNSQLYLLNEPLRVCGNVKDELYTDGKVLFVKRNIGKKIFDGSETGWHSVKMNYVYGYYIAIDNMKPNIANANITGSKTNYFLEISPNVNWNGGTNAMGFSITIDATPYIRFVKGDTTNQLTAFKNWLATNNIEAQYILKESVIEPLGYINLPMSYIGDNNIFVETGLETRSDIWYYWKNYDVLFAGVVKNSGDISLNPRHPHYCSLQVLDYKTFLSESNTLDFVIANKTISEAINMVVNAVSGYGFIVGNIDIDSANDVIGAYSTLNKSAYDVLQYLAEISGSRWRARVVDSLTMAIDFYDPDTLPQAEDLEYTQEYFENNNIVDLTFNYGTRDYRNKQILLSDEVYANINYDETLISNGYSNMFTLQNNIGDIVSVVVDGAEKTIGTNNDKQMGVEADFYYTPGKNVVESNSVYSAGTMIHLTYQPLVKGRQIVYNNSEVDRISQQTNTEGVIARYETRNDVLSSDELEKIAKTYIEYKGKAEVILTLKTQNKDLYDIGEVVYFNAPITDLAQNYMVKSKKIEYVVINKIINLFYVYEMTSSFNSEKAINYFDNQRSKATGNIEEGESITRNVDIETQASILWSEGSVSSATVTVTGDNILNCALNSPFVE